MEHIHNRFRPIMLTLWRIDRTVRVRNEGAKSVNTQVRFPLQIFQPRQMVHFSSETRRNISLEVTQLVLAMAPEMIKSTIIERT